MNAMVQIRLDPENQRDLVYGRVIAVLTVTEVITRIYAAIAVGHLWNNHRILGALLAYLGFQIVVFYVVSGVGVSILPDAFMNNQVAMTEILIQAVEIAVFGALTWVILDRRLNLE